MNNSKVMVGTAFAFVAVAAVCVFASSAGDAVVRLIGKAAWYLPYASAAAAVYCFRAAADARFRTVRGGARSGGRSIMAA